MSLYCHAGAETNINNISVILMLFWEKAHLLYMETKALTFLFEYLFYMKDNRVWNFNNFKKHNLS